MSAGTEVRRGATMIVHTGVAVTDRRLGLVPGGAVIMSVHTGSGVRPTDALVSNGTEGALTSLLRDVSTGFI